MEYYVSWGRYYCVYVWEVDYEDYYYEPDYRIYRVVDGQETLITSISGYQDSVNWMNPLDIFGELSGNGVDIPNDKLVFYDFDAPVYQGKDSTLSYRIVASTSRTKAPCADSSTYVSTLTVDENGDGDPDFIPWDLLHGAEIIPIITFLLLN